MPSHVGAAKAYLTFRYKIIDQKNATRYSYSAASQSCADGVFYACTVTLKAAAHFSIGKANHTCRFEIGLFLFVGPKIYTTAYFGASAVDRIPFFGFVAVELAARAFQLSADNSLRETYGSSRLEALVQEDGACHVNTAAYKRFALGVDNTGAMAFEAASDLRVDKADFTLRIETCAITSFVALPERYATADFRSLTIYRSLGARSVSREPTIRIARDILKSASRTFEVTSNSGVTKYSWSIRRERLLKKDAAQYFCSAGKNRSSIFASEFVLAGTESCVVAFEASLDRCVNKVHASFSHKTFSCLGGRFWERPEVEGAANQCAFRFDSSVNYTAFEVDGTGAGVVKNDVAANPAMAQRKREHIFAACEIEAALSIASIFADPRAFELNAAFVDRMIHIAAQGQKTNKARPDEIPLS